MAKRNGTKTGTSGIVSTMADAIRIAKTITINTFAAIVGAANANHGVTHAARNVSRFDGRRIMAVQNATLIANAATSMQLDDVQLLAVWRMAFPMASGAVFAADVARGINIVRGVRADYNRTGHNDPAWVRGTTPESVMYGAKRFDVPAPIPGANAKPAATKTAGVRATFAKPAGRLVRKSA